VAREFFCDFFIAHIQMLLMAMR